MDHEVHTIYKNGINLTVLVTTSHQHHQAILSFGVSAAILFLNNCRITDLYELRFYLDTLQNFGLFLEM